MLSILTSQKNFSDQWVGHQKLNQLGLHTARMRLAAFAVAARRVQIAWRTGKWRAQFARDGFIKVENFLPEDDFARLQKEVSDISEQTRQQTPYAQNMKPGFGKPINHDWGVDRFDGGTLNRFIATDRATMPETYAFTKNKMLQTLCRTIVGLPLRPSNVRIYELVHGNETANHDLQKDFHRDTFFTAMKFWYFIDPVTLDNGPFIYVPGSHKLTANRLEWEHQQAMTAVNRSTATQGGSFRITQAEMTAMGLPDPVTMTVPANTMLMADTLGFHRRGDAKPGTSRLSIYSSNRPAPFFPIAI